MYWRTARRRRIVVDKPLAACHNDDVVAADQQDQDEVHAVPMHAFGCGVSRRAGSGVDAELMNLDMPRSDGWHAGTKQTIAEAQDRPHARS